MNFLEKALSSKKSTGLMIGGAIVSGVLLIGKLLVGPGDAVLEDDASLVEFEEAEIVDESPSNSEEENMEKEAGA